MASLSIFNEECESALNDLRNVSQTLLLAAPLVGRGSGSTSVLDEESMSLRITENVTDVAQALRRVGGILDQAIGRLQERMEEHFVLFYTHMKRRADEESKLLGQLTLPAHLTDLNKRSPTDQSSTGMLQIDAKQSLGSLHTWLHLQLESVVQGTNASRGAVYLKSIDGSAYLRNVCSVDSDGVLPKDVGLASGSTLGTVVQHGIGVNIYHAKTEENSANSLNALKVKNGLILPLSLSRDRVVGCVVVADKERTHFDVVDEQRAWAFTTTSIEVLRRYSVAPFLQQPPNREYIAQLAGCSHLPTVGGRVGMHEQLTQPLGGDVPPLADIPRPNAKQLIVRFDSISTNVYTRDLQGRQQNEVSEEDVLESAAPYVRNVESLWRRSLDTVTGLRGECSKWDEELTKKNNRIIELEIQLKALQKQFHRLRNDVTRVKNVVPQHLQEQLSEGKVDPQAPTGRRESRKKSRLNNTVPGLELPRLPAGPRKQSEARTARY